MNCNSTCPNICSFLNSEYYDLPAVPKGELSEAEQDKLMWDSFRETYKDTEAGKYFNKAHEMMERGPLSMD
ncbi:hypothetical protein GLOIN_2v1653861 [Rhizophagus clarus]|uniref:Uncharacterized protein n=1 Tax=Rhizophagus clarus TaxID=94130 RepID=A0A8H3M731_9GLOM|nr:hypothetical protein GLOIN_2v1653861 [Rhizophagus clarus]